jgi:hypothetical protein
LASSDINFFDLVFALSLVLLLCLVGLTFKQYAISNDEGLQQHCGELIIAYYEVTSVILPAWFGAGHRQGHNCGAVLIHSFPARLPPPSSLHRERCGAMAALCGRAAFARCRRNGTVGQCWRRRVAVERLGAKRFKRAARVVWLIA